ncbi:glutathione transferase GstA [Chromobacterium sphagni]|uniref:Glutathione transferase GstA n=1 Tax=Chromobacterium sphagni TaxID=1903179 RepID=A0A1S1WYQ9_9NEIS|nr:glutathione transferase GstA [Chromobacterium sphagni]OHX12260.1 glutathione transferase GstA [Chromobacterium sphagni]
MKLYFAPHACSLAPHIVLRELRLPFELIRVDNHSKRTAEGGDFRDINPKGYVAALRLENGEVLTEGPAILQYLADLRPQAGLAPANGSWQRLRLQEMLNFISAELHAGSAPLFQSDLPEAARAMFQARLGKRLDWLDRVLRERDYLLGDAFSVADAYLYTVLGWLPRFAIDLAGWRRLRAFHARVDGRDAVRQALRAEADSAPV